MYTVVRATQQVDGSSVFFGVDGQNSHRAALGSKIIQFPYVDPGCQSFALEVGASGLMNHVEFEKPVTWKPLNVIALISPPHWRSPRGVGAGTIALVRHLTTARNPTLELEC